MEELERDNSNYPRVEDVAFELRQHVVVLQGYTEMLLEQVEASHPAAVLVKRLKEQLDRTRAFSKGLDELLRKRVQRRT